MIARALLFARSVSTVSAIAMASPIIKTEALGFPFTTPDPFLFCVHHKDFYPSSPGGLMEAPIRGNTNDFTLTKDKPFRMYHAENRIPGFPTHPHRGFETLTVTLEGIVDHFDSANNSGRYGNGDLQWMTAGKGCQHSEMFPLVNTDKPNTLLLFQIWLNLPKKNKFAAPGYKMNWAENVRIVQGTGGAFARLFAGTMGAVDSGFAPPAASWAAGSANDVLVAVIDLPAGGSHFTLPPAVGGAASNRIAYVVEGAKVSVGGTSGGPRAVTLRANLPVELRNDADAGTPLAQVLILQGKPIGEPVAQRGPFVMNTDSEIMEAYRDYHRTEFGGWKWGSRAPVFAREQTRFASYADGTTDAPPAAAAAAQSKSEL